MTDSPFINPSQLNQHALGLVFEHLQMACVLSTTDRVVLGFNQAATTLFGYTKEEIIGQSTECLYADKAEHTKLGETHFNTSASYSPEVSLVNFRTQSGKVFKGKTAGGPIKDAQGRVLYYVAFVQDESERLKTEHTLNQLHSITSSRHLNFEQRVQAILNLGCAQFGLPIAILSQISDALYTVRQAVHPEDALQPGMTFELGITYCAHVYAANDVQGFHCVSNSDIAAHPCFTTFGLEAYLGAPVFVDGHRYGTLNFSSPEPTKAFSQQDRELIRLFAGWIGHELARLNDLAALEEAHCQLEKLAHTDSLTGLANRRVIEKSLNEHWALYERYKTGFVVALFDFDHFKKLNDQYGHAAGDAALQRFGDFIRTMTRKQDVYGRWGGEEFLAVMPCTDLKGAMVLVERLVKAVCRTPMTFQGQSISLSLSVGVTEAGRAVSAEALLQRADELLYKA
ncbi:diguanylate cyclase, partial [Vibrio sp. B183]|uniref:bifunctional diguanylate cyclase/phosphodiesterase n=1 Tax=Vibrio sp. B183 TaxID=1526762 RepID=UPI0005038143